MLFICTNTGIASSHYLAVYLDYDIGRASSERIARRTNLRGNLRNRPENRERERHGEKETFCTRNYDEPRTANDRVGDSGFETGRLSKLRPIVPFLRSTRHGTGRMLESLHMGEKNHSRDRVNRPQRGRRIFRSRQLAATKSQGSRAPNDSRL